MGAENNSNDNNNQSMTYPPQQINNAINKGSKLEATILSGGYTNYSYKVYISGQPDS